MATKLAFKSELTVTETAETGSDPFISTGTTEDKTTKYTGLNTKYDLEAGSTPPVVSSAMFKKAMSGGAGTIDLTAVPGPHGSTVNGNTKKVRACKFVNPATNANAITIVGGASNGYLLFGASGSIVLLPGDEVTLYKKDNAVTIDGTHKTLDISGNGAQELHCAFIFG